MKTKLTQPNLFEALGFPLAATHPDKMPAHERHRLEVMIETMLKCFSNPTVYCNQPTSAIPPPLEWLKKHRMLIELERAARLMQLVKDKPQCSLDQIRACATTLTSPEKAGVLSVISGMVPPGREQAAEYLRAFAHCEELETLVKLFGDMPGDIISLPDVERFYQLYGGQGNWGWLDDRERTWIKEFNQKVRQIRQAR